MSQIGKMTVTHIGVFKAGGAWHCVTEETDYIVRATKGLRKDGATRRTYQAKERKPKDWQPGMREVKAFTRTRVERPARTRKEILRRDKRDAFAKVAA